MSHFTVAVITKDGNYEAALEPFNENLNVDPYISETREKVIEKYRKHLERNQEEEGKETSVSLALTDDQLLEEAKKYYDWETFDENGNIISTYNPKSKWDWWSLGGRWTGLLKLKQPTNLTSEELELKNKLEQEVLIKTICHDKFLEISKYVKLTDTQEIKDACKSLTKLFHPDNGCGQEVQKLINVVLEDIKQDKSFKQDWDNLIHFLKQASDYQGLQEKLNQLVSILNKACPTVERGTGSWATGYEVADLDRCDSAQVKDVDFTPDLTEVEKLERLWEVVVEDSPIREDEDEREFRTFYNKNYYLKKYGDKETYIKDETEFRTYALLYHGEWIEPGTMGWFGCSDADEDGYKAYREKFNEIISNLDPEEYISVIDCHI